MLGPSPRMKKKIEYPPPLGYYLGSEDKETAMIKLQVHVCMHRPTCSINACIWFKKNLRIVEP